MHVINATVRLDNLGGQGVLVPGGFILTAAHCIQWNGEVEMAMVDRFIESITTKSGARFRFVQLERAQPSEGWDSGSNPEGPTKRAGGRPARHLTVAQDHAGSTPVPRARFYGTRHKALSGSPTAFST